MKNISKESVIIFFKHFFAAFLVIYIGKIALALLVDALIAGGVFNISKYTNAAFPIGFSCFWALYNTPRYRKVDMELNANEYNDIDLLQNVKGIFSSMHWKVEKDNGDEVIFRSPLTSTLWPERVIARTEADKLKLSGAVYFLDKVAGKLKE